MILAVRKSILFGGFLLRRERGGEYVGGGVNQV